MTEQEFRVDNGTPNVHCGKTAPHTRHQNVRSPGGRPIGMNDLPSWCDGIPPLEPFLELTVRASLTELFGEVDFTHERTLHLVAKYGLGLLVDCVGKPETAMVLRVRTGDGKDRMYPIIKSSEGPGFKAVVDAEVIDVTRD